MSLLSVMPVRLGFSAGPRIIETEYERLIARLPGLLHYVDPGRLNSDGSGIDAFGQAVITPNGVHSRIASAPAFNSLPAIQAGNAGNASAAAGLRLPAGVVTKSFTHIGVMQLAGYRFDSASLSHAFSSHDGATTFDSTRYSTAGSQIINFRPTASGGINQLTADKNPTREQVHIVAVSFDYDTQESAVLQTDGVLKTYIHSQRHIPTPADMWHIGGYPGASNFHGLIGEHFVFDRALHLTTYRPFFDLLVAELKARYAIA